MTHLRAEKPAYFHRHKDDLDFTGVACMPKLWGIVTERLQPFRHAFATVSGKRIHGLRHTTV